MYKFRFSVWYSNYLIIKHIHIVILYGIHVKVKLYYFLFYIVFNTTFLVYCNYPIFLNFNIDINRQIV